MTERALGIALKARLYRLLAERPDFSRADPAERIAATSAGQRALPLGRLDQVLIDRADETDLMCGCAVRKLRDGGHGQAGVLDVLGMLSPDRILAMYYALPPERRRTVTRTDGVWSYHVARAPEDINEAQSTIKEWAEPIPDTPPEMFRFQRESRRYKAGLPHALSPAEVEIIETTRVGDTTLSINPHHPRPSSYREG